MYLDKVFIDRDFTDWINVLEQSVNVFIENYPELYNFWSESFSFYLKKLKKRVKKTNPRRYFQGQAFNYLLSILDRTVVFNIFSGALRNLYDTFEQEFFNQKNNYSKEKIENDETTFFLWINIDLLPTSITANCEYLANMWGMSSYSIPDTKYAYYTLCPNGIMLHLCGDLSQLPNYYTGMIDIASKYRRKLILGIEGIMNLPIFTKEKFYVWWDSFGNLIRQFDAFFGSWMAAGDHWKGLKTKIIFYQDVVKINHQQPLSYGQMVQFIKDKGILEENIILFSDSLPWNITEINECIENIPITVEGIILEYYISSIVHLSSLRFISSYITEPGLLYLCEKIVTSEYVLKVGYSDWNDLMGITTHSQNKEEDKTGFVKIFPFGFIKKNFLNEK